MRHTHILICQTDEQTPDVLTELACFTLPAPDVATIPPETVLDTLETTTQETGNAVMRRLLQVQWAAVDAALVEQHCQQMAPASSRRMDTNPSRWPVASGGCAWSDRSVWIRSPTSTACRATPCCPRITG